MSKERKITHLITNPKLVAKHQARYPEYTPVAFFGNGVILAQGQERIIIDPVLSDFRFRITATKE